VQQTVEAAHPRLPDSLLRIFDKNSAGSSPKSRRKGHRER
jgi:hypothetical protein